MDIKDIRVIEINQERINNVVNAIEYIENNKEMSKVRINRELLNKNTMIDNYIMLYNKIGSEK